MILRRGFLWLFVLAYAIHAIEEARGLGGPHGIELSFAQFLIITVVALFLMIFSVALALRFGFPQLLTVVFATAFSLNGISHLGNSVVFRLYDAGVVSGTLIFIPLGTMALIRLSSSMTRRRFVCGIALGVVIQAIAMIIAF